MHWAIKSIGLSNAPVPRSVKIHLFEPNFPGNLIEFSHAARIVAFYSAVIKFFKISIFFGVLLTYLPRLKEAA